jgi:hypothetical protein
MQSFDRELQARLLKEISELYARKQKVEDAIKSLEAATKSLQQRAALRDIEAHKGQHFPRVKLSSPINV